MAAIIIVGQHQYVMVMVASMVPVEEDKTEWTSPDQELFTFEQQILEAYTSLMEHAVADALQISCEL
ncbi:MAG: hypothetical protein WA110_10345 [Anaerolineaceae bacterium]